MRRQRLCGDLNPGQERGAEGRRVRPGKTPSHLSASGALALFQILLQLSSRPRFDSTESRRPRNRKRAADRVRSFNNSAKKDKEGAAGERQRTVEGSPAISGKGQGEGTDEDERTNERIKIWCSVLARWGKSNYCELNGN